MTTQLFDERTGTGNWAAFPIDRLSEVFEAAEHWKRSFEGIDRPWLCWCVESDWCLAQQQLVSDCGWTPVVGTDGRVRNPPVRKGSAFIDFNSRLKIPVMWMHFPLEFAFLFCQRIAFWHSDVLAPASAVAQLASGFELIAPGQCMAVRENPGFATRMKRLYKGLRSRSPFWLKNSGAARWFEVVGCTTAEASRSQFESGCGLWRHISHHPNAQSPWKNREVWYDHGVGLKYWEKYCGGQMRNVELDVEQYHYTTRGAARTVRNNATVKGGDLAKRYNVREICQSLGVSVNWSEAG